MDIVNLTVVVGLFVSGMPSAISNSQTVTAVNDSIAEIAAILDEASDSTAGERAAQVYRAERAERAEMIALKENAVSFAQGSANDNPASASASQWADLVTGCENIEKEIKAALSKGQMKAIVATEFRTDLSRLKSHVMAVKPKSNNLPFSQQLILARDIGDLKAQVENAIRYMLRPAENVEVVEGKLVAEIKEAVEKKQIAQADVDKLNFEIKEQEDLLRSMKRSGEAFNYKDQELVSHNFGGLQVALLRRVKFSRESIPLIDQQRKLIDEDLKAASTSHSIDAAKANQYANSLNKIATVESDQLAKGALSASQIVALAMQLDGLMEQVHAQTKSPVSSK